MCSNFKQRQTPTGGKGRFKTLPTQKVSTSTNIEHIWNVYIEARGWDDVLLRVDNCSAKKVLGNTREKGVEYSPKGRPVYKFWKPHLHRQDCRECVEDDGTSYSVRSECLCPVLFWIHLESYLWPDKAKTSIMIYNVPRFWLVQYFGSA